jgi:catalase
MARIRSHGEEAEAQNADATSLAFTADDGRLLAVLAGEGQARRRGNALRPGWRPVHTNGVLATGTFTATGDAGPSAPAHLRLGQEVTAVARFSSCQARLDGDDRRHGPRGLAVRFTLGTGDSTDLVTMNTDRFIVASRSAFVSASKAMSSRLPLRPVRIAWLTLVRQLRGPLTFLACFPPSSYARSEFHAVHTFVWTTHGRQPVRYRWRPVAGTSPRWPWNMWRKRADYLQQDLRARVHVGGVSFYLEVQQPVDVSAARLRDVARPLPRRVPWTRVGTLALDQLAVGAEAERIDRLLFSPVHLIEGIEVFPGDELMALRTAAYPASHLSRTTDPC